MANGAGPSHGRKRERKPAGKKGRGKEPKASRKRKGWVPAGLAGAKSE